MSFINPYCLLIAFKCEVARLNNSEETLLFAEVPNLSLVQTRMRDVY